MQSIDTLEQEAVLQELRWDPGIDAAHIGVSINEGAVTLTGHVSSYEERAAAEKAAKRVRGVTAVANDLEIHLATNDRRDDTDIAVDLARFFAVNVNIPRGSIQASVHNGWVTLDGVVVWDYQRNAALKIARQSRGVRGITNAIRLRSTPLGPDVEADIWAALRRCADLDARDIHVSISHGVAILRGRVASWGEATAARRAAAAAPGVREVRLDLEIAPRSA